MSRSTVKIHRSHVHATLDVAILTEFAALACSYLAAAPTTAMLAASSCRLVTRLAISAATSAPARAASSP